MAYDNTEAYIIKYYNAFITFLKTVGAYQAILKMRDNAEDGVYPVQVVAAKYGYVGAVIDQEVAKRNRRRWGDLEELNYWSRRAGFPPLTKGEMEDFLDFCDDKDRRRYLRDKVRKLAEERKLVSIKELVRTRKALEQKKKGGSA